MLFTIAALKALLLKLFPLVVITLRCEFTEEHLEAKTISPKAIDTEPISITHDCLFLFARTLLD